MKKNVIILICIMASNNVLSSPLKNEESLFKTIAKWDEQASSVTFQEFAQRVFSGKCFTNHQNAEPKDVAFVVTEKLVETDNGPAFPGTLEKKAMLLDGVNYFDEYNSKRTILISNAKYGWKSGELVLTSENSNLRYRQIGIEGEIKRFGSYLTTIVKLTSDLKCEEDVPGFCKKGQVVKKGTSNMACYFYKEELEK